MSDKHSFNVCYHQVFKVIMYAYYKREIQIIELFLNFDYLIYDLYYQKKRVG